VSSVAMQDGSQICVRPAGPQMGAPPHGMMMMPGGMPGRPPMMMMMPRPPGLPMMTMPGMQPGLPPGFMLPMPRPGMPLPLGFVLPPQGMRPSGGTPSSAAPKAQGPKPEGGPRRKDVWPVFVGNIAFDTTEQEVGDLFGAIEGMVYWKLSMQASGGGSRGFGFAEFKSPEAALEAIKKVDGADIRGRKLRLRWGESASTTPE
ncbi:unnamed protein product, partial [Polarella glacialis]